MQPKLLRVLESRTLRRVGEAGHRPIDVRFVSATHRNLRPMVNAGAFREDLYFRLAVLPVHVPPLREHVEDLPALIRHFAPTMHEADLASLCEKLSTAALPGNVRELRNVVERVRLLGHDTVTDSAEPFEVDDSMSDVPCDVPFHEFQERTEREYLRRLLARHGGKAGDAAQAAGINRTYFYRLLRKHSL
jgi:DNA-binding NtrC family response regulator